MTFCSNCNLQLKFCPNCGQDLRAKQKNCVFAEAELREGCKRSVENVKGLLNSASLLVKNRDSQQYALGLYVYAVEEYGKAILLRRYITGNKDKYQIPGWVLGIGNLSINSITKDGILSELLGQLINHPKPYVPAHSAKLLIGSEHLPSKCSFIPRGIRITTPIGSGITTDLKSNRTISVLGMQTGSFVDTTHIHFDPKYMTIFEFDLKTACFYMDFDKHNKRWKYDISTDAEWLKKNIKRFEETLDSFSCNR
jgi:hypothetical protein